MDYIAVLFPSGRGRFRGRLRRILRRLRLFCERRCIRRVLLYPASLWFLFLLFRHFIIHPEVERSRGWSWSGIIICFVFAIVSVGLYSSAANKVRQGEYDTRNPMTERVLGMHFRYHTSFCIYDGWRPPLHDPAMVIGTRLGGGDPLHDMSLEERLALYHKVFPNNPVKYPRGQTDPPAYPGKFCCRR